MIMIENVDGIIIGCLFGCWAWIFATKLIAEDAPLYWWPNLVDAVTLYLPERLGLIISNALYGCEKCVAGQFGLWGAIAVGLPYEALLLSIPASIITASVISRYL
jgi:hypothetical protein